MATITVMNAIENKDKYVEEIFKEGSARLRAAYGVQKKNISKLITKKIIDRLAKDLSYKAFALNMNKKSLDLTWQMFDFNFAIGVGGVLKLSENKKAKYKINNLIAYLLWKLDEKDYDIYELEQELNHYKTKYMECYKEEIS